MYKTTFYSIMDENDNILTFHCLMIQCFEYFRKVPELYSFYLMLAHGFNQYMKRNKDIFFYFISLIFKSEPFL